MKWRPVKTAPKDKLILLAQPPYNPGDDPWVVMQGRWVDMPHSNQVMKHLREGTMASIPKPPYDPGWEAHYPGIMQHGGMWHGYTYEPREVRLHPTHWMPLPKPPTGRFKQPRT